MPLTARERQLLSVLERTPREELSFEQRLTLDGLKEKDNPVGGPLGTMIDVGLGKVQPNPQKDGSPPKSYTTRPAQTCAKCGGRMTARRKVSFTVWRCVDCGHNRAGPSSSTFPTLDPSAPENQPMVGLVEPIGDSSYAASGQRFRIMSIGRPSDE